MKTAEFKEDGIIYSRGEEVAKYRAGDSVTVLQDLTERLVQIVIMEGEFQGRIVSIDKTMLKYHTMEFKID
jgi:hypothetical protein